MLVYLTLRDSKENTTQLNTHKTVIVKDKSAASGEIQNQQDSAISDNALSEEEQEEEDDDENTVLSNSRHDTDAVVSDSVVFSW